MLLMRVVSRTIRLVQLQRARHIAVAAAPVVLRPRGAVSQRLLQGISRSRSLSTACRNAAIRAPGMPIARSAARSPPGCSFLSTTASAGVEATKASSVEASSIAPMLQQTAESRRMWLRLAALGGGAAIAAAVASCCVRVVPAGHAGVVSLFGCVEESPRQPGLQLKHPLAHLTLYTLKTCKMDYNCLVPSNEGLNCELHISLQFRLKPEMVVDLFTTVGDPTAVINNVVAPQVHAAVRAATSAREAKALYTAEREQIRSDITSSLSAALQPRGVVVEDVPLRAVRLPERLQESIERKLQMEQESERMDWVLKKEMQEAERKAIEARGIADFQRIVSKGIDERLLKWKGVEATVELAKSDNAKVVVIGSSKDGMPLILGGDASR